MKKSYLLGMFALAAMTMVGCSNDEVVNDYSQDNAIEFGTYVGRGASSRAHEITTEVLGTEGFGVFAYYTGKKTFKDVEETATPNFMYNQKVEKANGATFTDGAYSAWQYDPVKYWPNNVGDMVSFFAYAPYKEKDAESFAFDLSGNNVVGYPTISYKVNLSGGYGKIDEQKDLLYLLNPAKYLDQKKPTVDSKITFEFGHALSRIAFGAQVLVDEVNGDATGDVDDATHTTTEIHSKTKITINSVDLKAQFYTKGTLNLGTGKWNEQATPQDYIKYILTKEDNFKEGENVFYETKIKTDLLNNEESYLMIMPQNFKEKAQIYVTVDYNVVTTDGKLDGGKSDIHNVITSVPFNFNFEQGKAYKFILHLGMTSVKLSATVTEWTDGGEWVVNVPINGNDEGDEWENYNKIDTSEGGNQGGDIEEGE